MVHFKCEECVKSLPRSQVSLCHSNEEAKRVFFLSLCQNAALKSGGQDWCQINNFTVLNFLKVEAPDKTTAVCTHYAL